MLQRTPSWKLERGLNITEEVMRHLVTRVERPTAARRPDASSDEEDLGVSPPPDLDELDDLDSGREIHRRVRDGGCSGRHRLSRKRRLEPGGDAGTQAVRAQRGGATRSVTTGREVEPCRSTNA